MIYSYLIQLCGTKMTIDKRTKKVYLLCGNSIKSNSSEIKKSMQKYVDSDVKFKHLFPVHRNQAIDYFTVQLISERYP